MNARSDDSSPPGRITLRVIADLAGVHPSTVSRVLRRAASGRLPGSPNDLRITRIASELGYVPDPNAASLKTNRTHAIGVLVPRLTDTVLALIYDSVEATANAAGYETFVANTHDRPEEQLRRMRLLISRRVDGLILGDAHISGNNLSYLSHLSTPFVLMNRRSPGHLSVTCDDFQGGHLVGEHLASLGHNLIGIVAGAEWASTSIDRIAGCIAGARTYGVKIPRRRIITTGYDTDAGRVGTDLLLKQAPPPSAIFALNDFAAIGAMGALRARGLVPGRDVAVVGYNDLALCAELPISLSSVRSPLEEMGMKATEALLSLLQGGAPRSLTLAPTLEIRESSAQFAS